jgi:hypothetical protein
MLFGTELSRRVHYINARSLLFTVWWIRLPDSVLFWDQEEANHCLYIDVFFGVAFALEAFLASMLNLELMLCLTNSCYGSIQRGVQSPFILRRLLWRHAFIGSVLSFQLVRQLHEAINGRSSIKHVSLCSSFFLTSSFYWSYEARSPITVYTSIFVFTLASYLLEALLAFELG